MINVIINGAQGKMGKITVESISHQPDFRLVATAGRGDDLGALITKHNAEVVIDFTAPNTIFDQAQIMIEHGARPVIGTTGLTTEQIQTLMDQCAEKKLGGIIAPNFSLSAVLLMKFAAEASKYFPDAEIIEMHNPKKIDAPSGTAKKTAELMSQARQQVMDNQPHQQLARGENYHGVTIHSVRLPGLVAHEMVMFASEHETLTLRQDSLSRTAFMPGVFLACQKVMQLDHLIYGLESLLFSKKT